MSPRTPAQYEEIREARKSAILEAALQVFAEVGFHSSTVSQVAKHAKISKGLIYNYFESKDELLLSIIMRMTDEVEERFNIQPGESFDKARIIEFVEKSFEIVLQDIRHWKLYFSLMVQPDVIPVMMEKLLPKMEPFMTALYGYFAARGDEDPMASMRLFSAMLDGVQMHIMLDPENFPVENVKKLIIQQLI